MTVAAVGNDTIVIDDGSGDRVLVDFANTDIATFTFPNQLVTMTKGKGGNAIYAYNETGKQVDVELRILKASPDDKFLNSAFQRMKNDLPSFNLLKMNFTQRVGDGATNVSDVVYSMEGGVFTQAVDAKSNTEGDADTGVSLYRLTFANNNKTL